MYELQGIVTLEDVLEELIQARGRGRGTGRGAGRGAGRELLDLAVRLFPPLARSDSDGGGDGGLERRRLPGAPIWVMVGVKVRVRVLGLGLGVG